MTLPHFEPGADPGPDFAGLLRRLGEPADLAGATAALPSGSPLDSLTHGTTCVAVRYDNAVLLAGDRRATAGNFISQHRMEKVFAADSHSGVAIAGVAGPATEMVRLFQLQLEHYEKVEGTSLSLEGKANQLGQMVRANLTAAMRGLVVVPIFAGYDRESGTGRIFEYDITGGRYEERDHAANGSGSMHASTTLKLGFDDAMSRQQALELALKALFVAAEADSATGGPDPARNIFPVVATMDADGYSRVDDSELSDLTSQVVAALHGAGNGAAKAEP